MPKPDTKTVLIPDIPVAVHQAARQRALKEGISLRAAIRALLAHYAKHGLPKES